MKTIGVAMIGTTLLVAAAYSPPARAQVTVVPRIINGTPTDSFESVGIVGTDDLGGIGTGTLISPTHVLTAAHLAVLAEGPTAGTFEIGRQVYETLLVYVHPRYNRRTLANDIAIYELSEPVEGVTPSPIYRDAPTVGELLTLVGFGAGGDGNTGQDGTFGEKMVGTTAIDIVQRLEILWEFDDNTESDTAYGDSGGPNFLFVDGEFYIAGITSGGSEPDSILGDVAFSTRVDAYAGWIDEVLATDSDPDDGEGEKPSCPPGRKPKDNRPHWLAPHLTVYVPQFLFGVHPGPWIQFWSFTPAKASHYPAAGKVVISGGATKAAGNRQIARYGARR